ncbi:bifunctional diguanylate cyclase/phosphodiesterase [Marinobacter mobilis]|uniref:cyclic-guanylate-specific phosphodiesterase n=1 Tax=Marinobacter mobilis TaxID=488533 RepID=A0A1H2WX28_9GAMM|nr:EAL domain-containing protein [Marinobacter mobilis]SDW85058.1 diguanylate cyclase (GGDEF) domain-containing protein [Marinobacter mobilis]
MHKQFLNALLSPLLPALVMLTFLAVALGLQHSMVRQQDQQIQAAIGQEADNLSRELTERFQAHQQAIYRMAQRLRVSPDMTEATWRMDARNYLSNFGIYQAIEWIDRDYFIRWIEPINGNESVVGFNIAFSDQRRRALAEAAANDTLDSSGVITLKQGGTGLVIYAPVGSGDDNNGFIAGVFLLENLADTLLSSSLRSDFLITIAENGKQIYQLAPANDVSTAYSDSVQADLLSSTWQLTLIPTEHWVQKHQSSLPWVTLYTLALMGVLVSLAGLLIQLVLKRHQDLLKTRYDLEQEIQQRQIAQRNLARLESTDSLTGLANRRFFMEDLAHTLILADRHRRQAALVMIDLDRFQMLNDSLGHQFGDELLIRVAERLNALGDERVMIAYAGGDEFMVCQQHVENIDDVIHLLGQIQKCFTEPYAIQGHTYAITATMGIAIYPQSGVDADVLLRSADIALHRAKENGRNSYQFYTEGMQDREVRRLELDKDLATALEQDQFVLHLQPQLDLNTMEVNSAEALIRWQHPQRGLIPPFEFIPLAEESGRITDIGRWVVMAACRQLAAWRDGPLSRMKIAINLSGRELDNEDLVDHIQRALTLFQVDASRLEVELTEEIFIQNIERNRNQLKRLHDLGVLLAIDDFGVGYSSLAYLRDFPVDLLKIDRSFITNITECPDDAIITRAVTNLAHNLGVKVVAEGVETEEQLEFLKNLNCDVVQGYLISRPVEATQLEILLRDNPRFVMASNP